METPAKEHELLKKLAGDWNAVLHMMCEEIPGKEHSELIAGGLWLTTTFTADMGGAPYEGHGVLGYDKAKKKYVSVWVDPSRTDIDMMEATVEGTARVGSTMMMGMTGEKVKTRVVEDMPNDNTRILTFNQAGPDGKEMEVMRIVYTRAKSADK
jgi:hypothetical protein